MSMEHAVDFEELERRRKKSSASRKQLEKVEDHIKEPVSESMALINEIYNPTFKLPETAGHYAVPDEIKFGDLAALQNLDERKLAELKEVFLLFDSDCDGLISKNDLRLTFMALGSDPSDDILEEMINDAREPITYEAFVRMMTYRTIELDPEDVLLEAWSKWDDCGTGLINRMKIYDELINYGDRLSLSEAEEALSKAPIAKAKTLEEPPMIDYPAFCRILSGVCKNKPVNDKN